MLNKQQNLNYFFLKNKGKEQYNDLVINKGFYNNNLIINKMKNGLPINVDNFREIGIALIDDKSKF